VVDSTVAHRFRTVAPTTFKPYPDTIIYREKEFNKAIPCRFVQVNHSYSRKGVLRGLHFQLKPHPQGKLVGTLSGRIFDVAVDLRKGSPSYKKWVSVDLFSGRFLWIPTGFAHGFLALEDSHMVYFVTSEYDPALDAGVAWNDPEIGVEWPIRDPTVSTKDKRLPKLKDFDTGFQYDDSPC